MPRTTNTALGKKLAGTNLPKGRTEPLWKGPEVDGVTQSLISNYLCCKERFRVKVIEGWAEEDRFNHRMEYGNMWHLCEETNRVEWETPLKAYCQQLCVKYPLQQEEIEKYYNVCKTQFPIYVDYWKKHPDMKGLTPLLQEYKFEVPYPLPSGRTVLLRGKWDSVDLVGKGRKGAIWLQENKAKGDIDETALQRQLTFDLQTMIYIIALERHIQDHGPLSKESDGAPLTGVRYNVIRRPLAGGKGSIRQHQPTKSRPNGESKEEYYARLAEIIRDTVEPDGSSYFFMRWNTPIATGDIETFKKQCLEPILENLCDDYEWWAYCKITGENVWNSNLRQNNDDLEGLDLGRYPEHFPRHFRLPFGIYNPIAEGRNTDLDEYLTNGSTVGLRQLDNLFPELA